jgi:outer membrane receptor protein involved in Fe transport
VGTRWQQDVTHVVGGSFRAQAAPTSWLSLTGVLHGRWEQAVRTPLTTEIPETQLQRGVVAGTLGAGFHPLDGALTVEPVVDIRWLGSTQDVFGASPRVALAGRVHPDVTLRTQGGRYFRPPSVFELQGDRGDRQGNPTLSPERGWQADVGVDWTPQLGPVALQVSATGLFNEATDLIVWIQNAQRTTIPVNLGRARIFGVEGAFRIDVGDWVQGRTALTWLDARNRTEASVLGNQIPNVPRWQVDQRVLFVPTPWLQFGWDGHVVDGTFLDATNILGVPTRVLHGLTLRLRPVDVGPTLEVRVSNVGDRLRQQVPADPLVGEASGLVWQPVVDFVGYPLAGRTVMVTLSWTGR